ncbi:MAG: DUF2065 domain-containing protein [Zoogloeaceae bacterium]|jgi:uncharacterized protein YjeT (DUF2065 family)|nr:DUF2065 domain-containing protein [Zoogloeaceae bacterium]
MTSGSLVQTLLVAFALMLVLEGVLPLVAPTVWREIFRRALGFSNGQLRFLGLASLLCGLLLLMVFA